MKNINRIILLTLALFIYSCDDTEVPNQATGFMSTATHDYNCIDGAAFDICTAFPDNGSIVTAQMTNIAAPQYDSGIQRYGNFEFNVPFGNCGSVNVPETGEYTSVIRFVEGTEFFCEPNPGMCWRWWVMQTHPSGFLPSCNNFIVLIDGQDPLGFEGPCI